MFTGSLPDELCQLRQLQVLDVSHNSISGSIPKCLEKLEAMKSVGTLTDKASAQSLHIPTDQYLTLNVKGREYEYADLFNLVNSIDLSSNNLSGEIPEEITKLSSLLALNLSRNRLTGRIPESMGNLLLLETLDLSNNHLWGPIPLTMTSMTFLSKLNLSHNNLSGPIPTANQFQTFNDPTLFEGNSGLCGPPLPTKCSTSTNDQDLPEEENVHGNLWFYASTGLGFIMGFWAVFGSLVIKRSWRHVYFRFLDGMNDRLHNWLLQRDH